MNLREIERSVSEGFVINKRGEWCSVNEAVEEEIYYMQHVENGEIIKDGTWVKIDAVFIENFPEKRGVVPTRKEQDPEDSIKTTDTQKIVIHTPADKSDLKNNKKESKKAVRVAAPVQEPDSGGYSETALNRNTQPEAAKDTAVKTPAVKQGDKGEVFDRKIRSFEANLARKESNNIKNEPAEPPAPGDGDEIVTSIETNSPVKELATSNTLDDWDRARRGKYTLIIIPLAAVLIAVIVILLIVL